MQRAEYRIGLCGSIVSTARQILQQATIDSDRALADFVLNNCGTPSHPPWAPRRWGSNPTSQWPIIWPCPGVEGLRVIDASVMFNIERAHTI